MRRFLHALDVAAHCLRMGAKHAMADKAVIVGSFATYAVIMVIFSGIIKMIPAQDLAEFSFGHAEMLWYMGLAELLVFTVPSWCFRQLQNDIASGQIHLTTLRPVSPALIRISVWVGDGLVRVVALIIPVFLLLYVLSDGFFLSFVHLAGLLLSLPISIFLSACGWYFVGASCLWFVQSEPAYWFWQKATFLFGAMLWPLAFYPLWLQKVAWATPFPSILAVCAQWALRAEPIVYLSSFAHQIFWAVVFFAIVRWFDFKILRHLQETGA